MKNIAFGVMGLGLVLLVLSGLWLTFFPGTSSWTSEKSAEFTKIKNRRHELSFVVGASAATPSMHSGPDTGQAKKEFDELTVKKEALLAEFNSIHDRPYTVAKFLKWAGISFAALGIIGVYAANQSR